MNTLDNNRLISLFQQSRQGGAKTLVPFITAGYPDMKTTEALLRDFAARGVRVCELGVPYSDPVADGAVIQTSYTEALAAGVTSDKILEMVKRFRKTANRTTENRKTADAAGNPQSLAVVLMLSYSIIYRHGVEAFCHAAAEAGVDGLIVPDLPLDEAAELERIAGLAGLANVMLIAPTTPPDRARRIAEHSKGFVYYISVAGITGARADLPPQTIDAVAQLRTHTRTPICVGFGISGPQQVRAVLSTADGAIVGSAIVKRIAAASQAGKARDDLVADVGSFVQSLLDACK